VIYDRLLTWCSERGEGSIDSFVEAHDWLCRTHGEPEAGNARLVLYHLSTLGHVEVDAVRDRWAVTPSAFTVISNSGANALLVGARPKWLMARLADLDNDQDADVQALASHIYPNPPIPQKRAPSARYFTLSCDEDMAALCARLKIRFEHRVAERLASALPNFDSYLAYGQVDHPPHGFRPRRLNVDTLKWEETDDDGSPGAYEYEGHGRRYIFNDGTRLVQGDRGVVEYAELRRARRWVIYHSTTDDSMFVPARAPLPLLYARTAVLRTGLLPLFTTEPIGGVDPQLGPMLRYHNVPRWLSTTISRALGQGS
jgi:hypothetical protein